MPARSAGSVGRKGGGLLCAVPGRDAAARRRPGGVRRLGDPFHRTAVAGVCPRPGHRRRCHLRHQRARRPAGAGTAVRPGPVRQDRQRAMTAVEKETGDPWQSAPNRRADLLLRLSSDPRKLAAERRALPKPAEASCSVQVLELALGLAPKQGAYDRLQQQAETLALARLSWSDKAPRAVYSGASEWAGLLQAFTERQRAMGSKRPADARL